MEQRNLFTLIPLTWVHSWKKPLWLQQWKEARDFGHTPNNRAQNQAKNILKILILCCFVFNSKAKSSEKLAQRTRYKPTMEQRGNKTHMFTQGPFSSNWSAFCFYPGVTGGGSDLWTAFVSDEKLCVPKCVWYSQYVPKGELRADEEGEMTNQTSGGEEWEETACHSPSNILVISLPSSVYIALITLVWNSVYHSIISASQKRKKSEAQRDGELPSMKFLKYVDSVRSCPVCTSG